MADVGGGSSELTYGIGGEMVSGKSVRTGAVRLTERYLRADPPSTDDIQQATLEARRLIAEGSPNVEVGRVVGVGGSAVNLARMLRGISERSIKGVHDMVISRSEMSGLVDALAARTVAQRKKLVGLEPKRADIVLGGAIILSEILAVTGAGKLIVSVRGLRFGVLHEMLGEE